jgi:hypothetical protein
MPLLMVSAWGFSALAPLNQNHRACNQDHRSQKTKWFQGQPEPMEHEEVAEPHGYGRNDDDEKAAIHDKKFPTFLCIMHKKLSRLPTQSRYFALRINRSTAAMSLVVA